MSEVFGQAYADAYDSLYQDKDYEAECDMIERIFKSHGDKKIDSILDLGCGTGNHVFPLAERGYEVVGVDRSKEMIAGARAKLAQTSAADKVAFHLEDIRQVDLNREFDAALMMFAVLGYQLENDDVLAALKAARRHLKPGGLFIFDVWFGPAVLHQRPAQTTKVQSLPGGKILRFSSGELDIAGHVCTVSFQVWRFEADRLAAETQERHKMRFFFPRELELFLKLAGFAPVRFGAFPDFDRDIDEGTWNILVAARAV